MYKFSTISALLLTTTRATDQTVILPSSCNDLPDGLHWLKLLDGDDYPPVQVECSNGYSILNVDTDDNLINYFSSWAKWHYGIAGPTNDDHVNWSEWYIPDDGSTEYLVSPSCDICNIEDTITNNLLTDTTYYMTGSLFGCWWWIRGLHDCDMDWTTYECFACECTDGACHGASLTDSDATTGICATHTRSSKAEVAITHDMCTRDTGISYKPSLGTDNRFCACVKPSNTQYFEVDAELVDIIEKDVNEDESSINDVYELYQKDFESGTYRIMKSGTYKIMEDITFDFNAGTSNEDGAWMPHEDQIDEYPGAGQYRDAFFLGFFAGITVECNDVIIDLNGYMLRQSQAFYFQQRWFSIIELANQPFMPGQGPGFFGGEPTPANGVEIMNGVLGLTSHHAIHGNRAKNIKIHDLTIQHFETHGIQLNGFENLEITDVEIKDSSQQAYLLGEYGHARMLLPRLRKIADENPTGKIHFYGREHGVTMNEIADEMEKQINMAFEYVMYGTECDKDDENYDSWLKAKENFINEDGIPYGSGMYGIFLSYPGANVFGYGHSNLRSVNAKIENVKVHGMRHKMQEYLRFHSGIPFYVNPFNAVFDVGAALDQIEDLSTANYVGNIMTDAYLAMNKLSDNWGYLGMQMLKNDGLVAWSLGARTLADDLTITCNADVMTHSGKGISGFRVDGVEGVEVSNIEIYDLYDYTPLGTNACGEYEAGGGNINGGHFLQKRPMQMGFSGHMVQGITADYCQITQFGDINVHDIGSANGLAFGISVWPGTEIDLTSHIEIKNIRAGFMLDKNELNYDSRPNIAPEACGLRVYWQYNQDEVNLKHTNGMMQTTCVAGHVGCMNQDEFDATMMGKYIECDNTEYGDDYQYLTEFDRNQLKIKDTSKDLKQFEARDTSLSPISSMRSFMKLFSFTPIAKKSAPEISSNTVNVNKNVINEHESFNNGHINLNPGPTESTNLTHLILLIVPFVALAVYAIMSRRAYNNQNNNNNNNMKVNNMNIQYSKVPTVERPNYGSL